MEKVKSKNQLLSPTINIDEYEKVPIKIINDRTISVLNVEKGKKLSSISSCTPFEFKFDAVSSSNHKEIDQKIITTMTSNMLNGINGTLVSYGQTNTGKTITNFGESQK